MADPKDKSLDFDDIEESKRSKAKNHLFVIGINDYSDPNISNLENAVLDAQKMVEILSKRYVFNPENQTTLYNEAATRSNIIRQFDKLIDTIEAHHILLVVDSCFSGSLILDKDLNPFDKIDEGIATYAKRVNRFRSRLGMAAGRIETVSDGWAGSHSPFARSLITYLETNSHPRLPAQWLFQHVNTITTYNADQTPISGVLDKSLHDGGEFIFELRPDEPQDWKQAKRDNTLNSYQTYIRLHPSGKQVEKAYWFIALMKDSVAGFRDYRRRYPQGEFVREALDRQEYVEERNKFESAKKRGEVALNRYLLNYPNGNFTAEANAEIQRILREEQEPTAWQAALQGGKAELKAYLEQFPDGPHAAEAKGKLQQIQQEQARLQAEKARQERLKREQADATAKAEQVRKEKEQQEAEARKKRERQLADLLDQSKQAEQANELPQAARLLSEAYQLAPKGQQGNIQQRIDQLKKRIQQEKRAKEQAEAEQRKKEKEAEKAARRQRLIHLSQHPASRISAAIAGILLLWYVGNAFFPSDKTEQSLSQIPIPNPTIQDSLPPASNPDELLNLEDYGLPSQYFIPIEGGTFEMGSTTGDDNEKPVHSVTLSSFELAQTEVTNEQFCAFLNAKGNQEEGGLTWLEMSEYVQIEKRNGQFVSKEGMNNHPVVEVSWYGAKAYCEWLSDETNLYFRLPTEAEWEYAAGGGDDDRSTYSGTSSVSQLYRYANLCDQNCTYDWADSTMNDDYSQTAPVKSYLPNRLGLYDMSGNVWEWCQDWYDSDYYAKCKKKGTVENPTGPKNGSYRVGRGGSWYEDASNLRVAGRDFTYPDLRGSYLGFRPARQD